ncbi:copper resistance CopC family protein [Actinokineospora enzanensis]|uniref:copper resistance CopC family protein n=1 Tax=Actinokineospora enzanensis TaxID=155975 RepID=UPI00037E9812|nr:copper resistance CopC family protein [Actinokineospora enzanensis]
MRDRRAHRRVLPRAAAALVLAVGALIGLAGPAFAHNQLISSDPADKAALATGPAAIQLTFDQPVQAGDGLNSIVVVGPDGQGQWQNGKAAVAGNIVSVPVRPLGPAGAYKIGYRILSADGHPVSGELAFTLTTAGTGTPAPADATAQNPAAGSSAPGDDGGVPVWVWIAGAVVLLGAGIFLAMRVGGTES